MWGAPERPIQAACELCGIAHQQAPVSQAAVNQLALDSLDAPVHHVARGNAVRTRLGVRKRHLGDALRGRRRIDRAVLVEEPTVPVRRVLAQTDVRRDEQRREEHAQLLDGQDHGPLRVVRGRATHVLFARQRHAEENDAPEALLHQGPEKALQPVDAPPALPW